MHTRWVLTRKLMDGQKGAKALLVAKAYQDTDLKDGIADASGCVSLGRLVFERFPWAPSRNGVFGASTFRMPFCRQMALVVLRVYAILRNGILRVVTKCGS